MTAFPTLTDPAALAADAIGKHDIDRVMQVAIAHHRKQEYAEAAALYAQVIGADGEHVDAHYHLGVLHLQLEQHAEAVPHFEIVLGQLPQNGQIWIYYINALVASGQPDAARAALEIARQHGLPDDAVRTLLARIDGEDEPAEAALEAASEPAAAAATEPATRENDAISSAEAVASAADVAETADTAATADMADAAPPVSLDPRRASPQEQRQLHQLVSAGKLDAALKLALHLTEQNPAHGECWLDLGLIQQATGNYRDAVDTGEHAARLLPNHLPAQTQLSDRLILTRQYQRAKAHCLEALERFPESAALHRNLGSALLEMGSPDEGFAHLRRATELKPTAIEYDTLATAMGRHGLFEEAEATFRRALEMSPMSSSMHSNLLFYVMHKPNFSAAEAFAEFREFAARHEAPLAGRTPRFANDRNPSRRLKVGFVSGDLINHPVAYFFLSVLEQLVQDPSLSLHIYSNYVVTDGFTTQIRQHATTWTEIFGMSNELVAQKIRDDGIDILVDLSGHTGRNRLVVFAQRAAPVQVSWIGNPATTGLDAVDYYLSDRFVTPLDPFESRFSETLAFLPALAPFKPHPKSPDVNELPALKNGYITFGSFSRIVKIGKEVVALWARVLREVPNSRMLIGAVSAKDQMVRLIEMFAAEGIEASRVSFLGRANVTTYLQQHNLIDVCLDTFPFGNSTTTMQALWMGVPTMTLPGDSMASRSSTGWLTHLGLDAAFVAQDKDDFVHKCAALAADPEALAVVRQELREYCRQSVLIDAGTISRAAARAFRIMWKRWCDGLAPEHFEVLAQDVALEAPIDNPADSASATDSASAASAGQAAEPTLPTNTSRLPAGMKPVRFVCGTRSSRAGFFKETALGRSLMLYQDHPSLQVQLFDENTRGLSSIYNEAIDHAKAHPAILVFVHDDVWLTDNFWDERIRESLAHFDIVGIAGNRRRLPRQPAWCFASSQLEWDDVRYLSGSVGHGKGFPSNNVRRFGPSGQACKLLDGLLLIADSETLVKRNLRFDEQFKFHFYDMDFCRQAELKNLRMGTWPMSVVHESVGAFGPDAWREGYERYLNKYKD
ncbi:O-linked N-acetylglucosamine transferase family protein [Paraburkholderia acidisoli]|uniref:protein O-GlcNAc transferase n=1 Tax=Paraburkholderia acidisoli TaxID=2571748 RepID=A0A7Z2JFG0_9BURK|nr:tetratricopeptide repeat protein [Paraburkholderia acidisoli]QGZ62706.1 tetratricopeptide repeat protein [Paraburkholderia acidisoli]